jgi:hypothetical protein
MKHHEHPTCLSLYIKEMANRTAELVTAFCHLFCIYYSKCSSLRYAGYLWHAIKLHNKKKKKVKLSLCLTKHHAMKTYWESAGITPRILDLSTRWRWVDSFTPRPLYPKGKSTHWIGGWEGPRAVLDAVVKRKIPSPAGNRTLEPRTTSPQPSPYTDWDITAQTAYVIYIKITFLTKLQKFIKNSSSSNVKYFAQKQCYSWCQTNIVT